MRSIAAIVLCSVLCRIIRSEELTLYFDDLSPLDDDQYVIGEGLSVTLVCIVHSEDAEPPTITKLTGSDETDIVINGVLVSTDSSKYSLRSLDNIYVLRISDVTGDDTADYRCESLEVWTFFFHSYIYHYMAEVQLVVQAPQQLPMPMCFENGLGGGVYFVGDDVTFGCLIPTLDDNSGSQEFKDISDFRVVIISNRNTEESLTPDDIVPLQAPFESDVNYHKLIYTVRNVDETYNGTSIACHLGRNQRSDNFCDHLPEWKIYRELTVTMYPSPVSIQNGDPATFTCSSVPTGEVVDWMVSEGDHTIGSFRPRQTSQGSVLTLENVQFGTEGNGVFQVSCHVKYGTRNVTRYAVCYLRNLNDLTTATVTSPGADGGVANRRSAPAPVTIVIIPIVVIFVMLLSTGILVKLIRARRISGTKYSEEPAVPSVKVGSISSDSQAEISGQFDKISDENKLIRKDLHDAQNIQVGIGQINGGATSTNASNLYTATAMDFPPRGLEVQSNVRVGYASNTEENETSLSDKLQLGLSNDESESVRNIIYESYD